MARVLGISAYYHDSAAALMVDGTLVAAMQEERFSRIKNDPALPLLAATACLAAAGLQSGDLDAVVYYENPFAKLARVLTWLVRSFPRSIRQFPLALRQQLGHKIWVLDAIAEGVGVDRAKVEYAEHHRCHAASAFFLSPFSRAAVLTVDGAGEDATTAIWLGDGNTLTAHGTLAFPHSLGLLYGALTAYLGFAVNEGEYKVMGLAAFGTPRFGAEFAKLLRLDADGSFELGLEYFAYDTVSDVGFSAKLEQLLGPRRRVGAAWNFADPGDRRYADIAASLQVATETALLALAHRAKQVTGATDLCLAGGVALNAVANARLQRESGFARVFVQPAAGDAGGAIGAAILGAIARGDERPAAMTHAALGTMVDSGEAAKLADAMGIAQARVAHPAEAVAERLARNEIVAVCTGRFEWGPRALGQRSILARAEDADVRERLNRVIKRREPFRPFAPAVREVNAARYFADAPNAMTPFMTSVSHVHQSQQSALAAVTHVDGTARVQTVSSASAPLLYDILGALADRTGADVVLNTSLNGVNEPICSRATDAVAFFVAHPLDAMLIGDILLQREKC
jgi:carbamoyltransferase